MACGEAELGCLTPEPAMGVVKYGQKGNCVGNVFDCNLLYSRERKVVCVTSGNSCFGAHLAKKLLTRGYLVRVTVQNSANFEDLKEYLREEEMAQLESVVVAEMGDVESLCKAFRGCHAIFHTSTFIDPRGISGYTERMAFLETEGARNVVEACGRAAYVKRCIFTSSLLATLWAGNGITEQVIIDESCWSSEEFCRENKLWLALGKTRAEKVAWMKSRELRVNLVTLCPGLSMAPSFPDAHVETAIPYLKGGQIMLQRGVLATEDVKRVAEAHVAVYEDMDYGACGRYICYEKVITRVEDAVQLESRLKMHGFFTWPQTEEIPVNVSNGKITKLLCRASPRNSCKEFCKSSK
ncbi:OLC1v1009932C1 [Oldenlandia corymbosa var. corymbosa]|uniref:OLC1v1009932C1 n=1 Tax=Oldenlandia corymbosa var. corymbosa TaxID=529605 RepID=A0AAV1DT97_OLDCO|nr:OLC1v1009932C1 [Oldenlandia corymbosa var. corymbosa]